MLSALKQKYIISNEFGFIVLSIAVSSSRK